MTLTDFLLARIAEDEAAVQGARIADGPARVLAECEAKRRIVALVEPEWTEDGRVAYWEPALMRYRHARDFPVLDHSYIRAWEDVLRVLALPHADHPDYDDGWRP
ncbi:MAG: hypothetical protein H6515_14165 [Microthrixaceae bacterium]|nr:hypothetical protein [Microthrixaceae bacterium]